MVLTTVKAKQKIDHLKLSQCIVEEREVKIPHFALSFKLDPQFIATDVGSEQCVVFLNAKDLSLYREESNSLEMIKGFGFKEPLMRVWILSSKEELNYTKVRIIEEGWRLGVLVRVMATDQFSCVVASSASVGSLTYGGESINLPDVILPRIGAKITYSEMALLRFFENCEGCLVVNQSIGMEISRDKLVTMQALAKNRIAIPTTISVNFPITSIETIEEILGGYPMILKKTNGSQGKGCILINGRMQLKDLIEVIDPNNHWILQQFITKSKGKDLRVIVMGDKIIGAIKRVAEGENFKANFHQGAHCELHHLDAKLSELVRKTAKICCLDISGVDVLMDGAELKICEINSSPGCEGFELAHQGMVNVGKCTIEYLLHEYLENQKRERDSKVQ